MSEEKDTAWYRYAREHPPQKMSIADQLAFREGFDAGYDARDQKTCEWVWSDHDEAHYRQCAGPGEEPRTDAELHSFCPYCSGRIVEAKQ